MRPGYVDSPFPCQYTHRSIAFTPVPNSRPFAYIMCVGVWHPWGNSASVWDSPLLAPSGPRRIVHSSMTPNGVNNCLTSSSVCCLLSMPTNSFRSATNDCIVLVRFRGGFKFKFETITATPIHKKIGENEKRRRSLARDMELRWANRY